MTTKQFIAQVIELASAGLGEDETGFSTPYVEQLVPVVMQRLAETVNADAKRAHLLNKQVEVLLDVSGVGDLATATLTGGATPANLLLSGRPFDNVRDADGNYLEFLPTLFDLNQPHNIQLGYYAIEQSKLYTKPANFQEGASLAGTITFNAPVEPTPATLHAQLVPDALNLAVGLLREGRQQMAAGQPGTQAGKGQV